MSAILELNDAFRRSLDGGMLVLTDGIKSRYSVDQAAGIIAIVQYFSDFSEGNDPYGEHDFGAFDRDGQKIFWKIDYFNRELDGGAEDPADAGNTTRVLTIMLADEY